MDGKCEADCGDCATGDCDMEWCGDNCMDCLSCTCVVMEDVGACMGW